MLACRGSLLKEASWRGEGLRQDGARTAWSVAHESSTIIHARRTLATTAPVHHRRRPLAGTRVQHALNECIESGGGKNHHVIRRMGRTEVDCCMSRFEPHVKLHEPGMFGVWKMRTNYARSCDFRISLLFFPKKKSP